VGQATPVTTLTRLVHRSNGTAKRPAPVIGPSALAASERQNQRLRLLLDIGARKHPRMVRVVAELHEMLEKGAGRPTVRAE
jgi:hypothetical protein